MPVQLQRIFLVFLGFIVLFFIAKHFLTADTFGQYGHYRGASLEENKQHVAKYVDQETCADCHQEIVDLAEQGLHDIVKCQICHGPGYLHIDTTNYTELKVIDTRKYCGTCHNLHPARPADEVAQIRLTEHKEDEDKCINCHNPHEPWLDLD
jgi:ribosomal protein L37AE/L43A